MNTTTTTAKKTTTTPMGWERRQGEHWLRDRECYDRMLELSGDALIERSGVRPGEQVLDVGGGAGATTAAAASGSEGHDALLRRQRGR